MADTSPEIKTQPPQMLEISGYWIPYKEPISISFRDQMNNTTTTILSIGILGTEEIRNPETNQIIQDSYHVTPTGQVVRLRAVISRKGESRSISSISTSIIGSNGRIEFPEDQNPNKAKLIYEPRVVIK